LFFKEKNILSNNHCDYQQWAESDNPGDYQQAENFQKFFKEK